MSKKVRFYLTVVAEAVVLVALILGVYYTLAVTCVLMHGAAGCR